VAAATSFVWGEQIFFSGRKLFRVMDTVEPWFRYTFYMGVQEDITLLRYAHFRDLTRNIEFIDYLIVFSPSARRAPK